MLRSMMPWAEGVPPKQCTSQASAPWAASGFVGTGDGFFRAINGETFNEWQDGQTTF